MKKLLMVLVVLSLTGVAHAACQWKFTVGGVLSFELVMAGWRRATTPAERAQCGPDPRGSNMWAWGSCNFPVCVCKES